ncbi:hypothetical protein [Paraglaciecola sp.]|uniref:hypothetical protein n=1 Tax=Paraglaciecola sp. TaxID=1920173 RepID=UPI003EF4296A
MCDGTQTLKFCTCSSKIDRTKDHWLLSRKHAVQPFDDLTYLVGMIESPYDIDLYERAQCVRWIKAHLERNQLLDTPSCFDFNYEPLEDDLLKIQIGTHKIVLTFSQGEWGETFDSPFTQKIKRTVQAKGYVKTLSTLA